MPSGTVARGNFISLCSRKAERNSSFCGRATCRGLRVLPCAGGVRVTPAGLAMLTHRKSRRGHPDAARAGQYPRTPTRRPSAKRGISLGFAGAIGEEIPAQRAGRRLPTRRNATPKVADATVAFLAGGDPISGRHSPVGVPSGTAHRENPVQKRKPLLNDFPLSAWRAGHSSQTGEYCPQAGRAPRARGGRAILRIALAGSTPAIASCNPYRFRRL